MPDRMWVGGEWVAAKNGGTWPLVDPGTEDVLGDVPYGDIDDARAALDAAAAAFPEWSKRTAYDRGAFLDKAADYIAAHVDEFARRTTEESGKPLAQSKG